ncbi:hypothetical protein ACI796_01615 [Geodermatophilus sp. SYSU D00525]
MTGELRWAVTDGPDGTAAVELPRDDDDAWRLEQQARGGFWCAREAGGCGGRLEVERGPRPAFRHVGSAACGFARRGAAAGPAYDALRYRRPLVAWLTGQGHEARVVRAPDPGGHPGLHVVVPGAGVLEVQLAPLADDAWRERDDLLRRADGRVTWLHGPDAEVAAAAEARVRGAALVVRRHDRSLMVGVRDADAAVRWVRLAACRLTADGLDVPGLADARARHARRTAEREAAARRAGRAARRAQPHGAAPWLPGFEQLPLPAAGRETAGRDAPGRETAGRDAPAREAAV